MKRLTKPLFLLAGFIFLGLGTVGIFLPVLPTTPFYLLTCVCFGKGSQRFHTWFTGTNLYKKHVEEFIRTRSMTLRRKITICVYAGIVMVISFIFTPVWIGRVAILCAMLFMWYYFAFRIKTIPPEKTP